MLNIALLGQFSIIQNQQPLTLNNKPAQLLLSYLLLNNQTHRREKVAGLLWADSDEKAARKNLRNTVWRVRKLVGDEFLQTSKMTIGLSDEATYWLDVAALTTVSTSATVDELETAVSNYAGELLPGFYDEWLFLERERVRAHYAALMQALLHTLLADHQWRKARTHAEKWLSHGHQPEPAYRTLMQSYAALGDIAGMVNTYQRCIKALNKELGLPPSPETIQLYDKLLQQKSAPPQAAQQTKPATEITKPSTIHNSQLTINYFSPPAKPTNFVGREKEIAHLADLLTDPSCRLVTIVGMGGMGKTQLSLAVANQLAESPSMRFRDGILFVPLASISSGSGIISAVAKALSLSLSGQADSQQELLGFLADKALLIVLDNFEQLVAHADLVSRFLAEAPGLKLLITCREPLHLAAEWRLDLDGLPTNRTQTKTAPAALQLFEQAAHQTQPSFSLTAENRPAAEALCSLVAGVPLAIKLAATWLRVMPLPEIVSALKQDMDLLTSRLRDVPVRQRSMRVIFEHSWSLLTVAEQEAFGNLSVFRGGFTAEAAKEVTAVSPFLLVGLIDRGLLQFGNDRYDIHELTRQFAAEKLNLRPNADDIRHRHSVYFLQEIVCRNEDNLQGSNPLPVVNSLREQLGNIHQAWWWAIEHEELNLISRVMGAMTTFFELAGLMTEGGELFGEAAIRLNSSPATSSNQSSANSEKALAISRLQVQQAFFGHFHKAGDEELALLKEAFVVINQQQDEQRLAEFYYARGSVLGQIGRLKPAKADFMKARDMFHAQGRRRLEIDALLYVGEMESRQDRPEIALPLHQEALALATKYGDIRRRALATSFIGTTQYYRGNLKDSVDYLEMAVELFEQLNDRLGYSRTMNNIGYISNMMGDYGRALFAINRSINMLRQIGIAHDDVVANDTLGEIYLNLGNYEAAEEAYSYSIANLANDQMQWQSAWVRQGYMRLLLEMGRVEEAKRQLLMAEVDAKKVGNPSLQAEVLASHGLIAFFEGENETAVSHFTNAQAILQDVPNPFYRCRVEVWLGLLKLNLAQFDEAKAHLNMAIETAQQSHRRSVAIATQFQLVRLAHLQGNAVSALAQLDMLEPTLTLFSDKTAVLDLRYQITKDTTMLPQLIDQYGELAEQTPRKVYQNRLAALTIGKNTTLTKSSIYNLQS